jgi:hypothetical protein
MTSLDDRLHDLFGSTESPVDNSEGDLALLQTQVRDRHARRRAAVVLAAAGIVAIAGVAFASLRDDGPDVEIGPSDSTTITISPPSTRRPADSQVPASGFCPLVDEPVVDLEIHEDGPRPRCQSVTATGRLLVRNKTAQTITVSLADFVVTLAPGEETLFDRPFGDYLEPGVHSVNASPGPGGGEIWFLDCSPGSPASTIATACSPG